MKTKFDLLIERRAHAMASARCPYDGQQLRQMAADAVVRADDEQRRLQFRRRVLERYAAAACITLILLCGSCSIKPGGAVQTNTLPAALDRQSAVTVIGGMLNCTGGF